MPMKRGRGRPRKHPVNPELVDVTGEGDGSVPRSDAAESGGNLQDDLQFSDSDMSDGEIEDDTDDFEDVDVTGEAGGISVTVDTSEGNNDEMNLYQEQLSAQNLPAENAYDSNIEGNMMEEVVDEDYDPSNDFLQTIGRGNENQSLLANSHHESISDQMQGAFVAGTVEMPSNFEEGTMVINALPPPEEGGPQALSNYTIVDSHHVAGQESNPQASGTIEDDLDISDDSDDGENTQKQHGNPIPVPQHPFGGAQQPHQLPPGAMSVRVQEDDEIWF